MSVTALAEGHRRAPRITRIDVGVVGFTVSAAVMAWGLVIAHGRPYGLLAVLLALAALAYRRQPLRAAVCVGAAATWLRLSYVGIGYSTQIDSAKDAAHRAFAGMSPYGVLYPSATTPPEPYVYGPIGLVWWQPGVAVELLAAIAVTALLIGTRSWITLAIYSGLPFSIFLTTTGVNDYSPGLLIVAALLLVRTRPVAGAALLGVAAAVKPYAFAWFLPVIGYGGWAAAASLAATTAVLWSPLLVWGPAGFIRSVQLLDALGRVEANVISLPIVRWLAVPLALLGLLKRSWEWAVLLGAGAFIAYLFFGVWASLGYWLAVVPAAGIALERLWMRRSGWAEATAVPA